MTKASVSFWGISCVLCLLLGAAGRAQGVEKLFVDETGYKVSLNVPVKRAVVFNTYNAEFFRAVGGKDVLVGLDRGTFALEKYWPGFSNSIVVGQGQQEPNWEKVVSARPDVVVMPRNGAYEVARQKLGPFGIPVIVMTGWDVTKHYENVLLVGELTGRESRALALNAFHKKYDRIVDERVRGLPTRSIYLEKGAKFFTSLVGSGWHDMIVQAGGRNIFDQINFASQAKSKGNVHEFEIDAEAVIRANPYAIIKQIDTSYLPPGKEKMAAAIAEIKARPGWDSLDAVKSDRIYIVTYFGAGAVSKLVGKLYIAKFLHPALFANIDPAAVMKEWLTEYQGVEYLGPYASQ